MGIYQTQAINQQSDKVLKLSVKGLSDISVSPPPEFGGPEGYLTPEDLFSASISTCFILTFKAISRAKKLDWKSIDVKVEAKLEKSQQGLKFTTVDIFPVLTICCKENVDPYLELLAKAKDSCLVTKSMNCDFSVHPKIKLEMVKK